MRLRTAQLVRLGTLATFAALIACGGYSSPTGPSGGGSSGGGVPSTGTVGTSGATITITASGISPSSVTIAVGQSVTFINNDTRSHTPSSDPHPTHTNCPAINFLGTLSAGQSKLTYGFAGAGTCGFHDHDNPDTVSLKGTIVIQ